jgi:hypothetical protein
MSYQEEDQKITGLFFENINNEFFRGEPCDDNFWKNVYQKLPVENRCDLWWMKIMRYEHMVHGEFNQESIEREVSFLHKAISEKDSEGQKIIDSLSKKLKYTGLQNEEISDFMAQRLHEL